MRPRAYVVSHGRMAELHDDLGRLVDLLKAISLMGAGIGGEIGCAVSAVAEDAKLSADSAWDIVKVTLASNECSG